MVRTDAAPQHNSMELYGTVNGQCSAISDELWACVTYCFISLSVSFEFGRAVWLRFYPSVYPPCPHPSFVAHLGGVGVGITLGVVILRNYEQRLQDQSVWWIFVSMYVVFVLFAIFWNIFAYSLLDLKLPPLP